MLITIGPRINSPKLRVLGIARWWRRHLEDPNEEVDAEEDEGEAEQAAGDGG